MKHFTEFEDDHKPRKPKLTKNAKSKRLSFNELEETIQDKFYYKEHGHKKHKKLV